MAQNEKTTWFTYVAFCFNACKFLKKIVQNNVKVKLKYDYINILMLVRERVIPPNSLRVESCKSELRQKTEKPN